MILFLNSSVLSINLLTVCKRDNYPCFHGDILLFDQNQLQFVKIVVNSERNLCKTVNNSS